MRKKVVVQQQPSEATIVTRPDCGPTDASTGQLISIIKDGTSDPATDPSTENKEGYEKS